MRDAEASVRFAVDAHVHLYEPARAAEVLAQAAQNVRRASGLRVGALLLSESAGFQVFDQLAAEAKPGGPIEPTSEPNALWRRDTAADLLIVAGRQLVSREGVEVLALGLRDVAADGAPLDEMVEALLAREALVVAPWGVGKWVGRRGRLIEKLIATRQVCLGDNGGRPAIWRSPLLGTAQREGVNVLPGSDVLPIPGRACGVGGFGFVVDAPLDPARPAAALLGVLKAQGLPVRRYGALRNPAAFAADQVQLRLRKRRPAGEGR
jgi:hypothetical protein